MARPPLVFKRSTNLLLAHIKAHVAIGEPLPTEQQMAALGEGSRTAIRSVLAHFHAQGLIGDLKERRLLRKPQRKDYFDIAELQPGSDRIREVLMERIYQSDLPPGAEFSEAELARASGTSTISVREFLIEFSRFGLIEKKPRGGWRLQAFDRAFAMELADVRQMFEFAALEQFGQLPPNDPACATLDALIARHEQLGSVMPARHKDFPALDRDFHTFLIGLLHNRFAQGLYDIVSLVFHYHYQWDKDEELARNQYAVHEHLDILRALARRDIAGAREAMRIHLDSSRSTLLHGIRTREQKTHPG
ncbi:DNA-binding GntR family transcriptional regulator [Pseudoduganella lurida]|uniref:DNA-binding GntR family transcriptional regulator n=1 Tax=Pseudoduganella lurida TaxID=1036180 RepID=A0A562R0S6_9BURK|nr:GntR family transcriptional regulator [Pseudoduganella lurida]TWI62637.1 DNA-binding GntR family transcriptional regulator [Pseudoduganella lurida]